MSNIVILARDERCLMAVDARDGGRWLSVLRPGGVQPSPVERNFATEPGRFYEVGGGVSDVEMLNDDFVFECDFENNFHTGEGSIFYSYASKNLFGVYLYPTGKVGVFSSIIASAGSEWTMWYLPEGNYRTTRNTIKVSVIGDTVTLALNGVLVETISTLPRRVCAIDTVGGVKASCGYLHNVRITNLTKNKVVWSYPSWPEKVRLLTYDNVTTSNGVFEPSDPAVPANAKTAFAFGKTQDYTVFARVRIPETIIHHTYLLAGNPLAGGYGLFSLQVTDEGKIRLLLTTIPVYLLTTDITPYAGQWVTVAVVLSLSATRLELYLNGALAASCAHALSTWETSNVADYTLYIGSKSLASFRQLAPVKSVLVYQSAQSASQINAISKFI